MVDQQNATSPQGGGQPPERPAAPAATGQPVGPGAVQPQYVTLEQAQAIAADAAEEAFRRAQSLYSKGQAGFEKKVQADLKNLEKALEYQKKAGVTITPEQESNMRQQVINQAFMDTEQPTQPQLPGEPSAQALEEEELLDPVTASAWQMMEKAQIDILEEDPEYSQIVNTQTDDPYVFLRSIEAAIEAKRKRLAAQPNQPQQPPRLPTNMGGAGGPTNPVINTTNMDELWKMTGLSSK
jgi:tetratricopeptide (TPR) repeat protein